MVGSFKANLSYRGQTQAGKTNDTCTKCLKKEHVRKDCTNQVTCNQCNTPVHIRRNCPTVNDQQGIGIANDQRGHQNSDSDTYTTEEYFQYAREHALPIQPPFIRFNEPDGKDIPSYNLGAAHEHFKNKRRVESKTKPKQSRETPKKQESRKSENENKGNLNTDISAVSQPKITTFFSSGESKTSEQSQNHEQNKVTGDSDAESSSSYDTEYESDLNAVSDFSTESTPAKSPQEKTAAAVPAAVDQSQEKTTKKKKRKRKH